MADTIRQLAALQALLADNTGGAISPQDLRDFLVSVMPPGRSATKVVTHPAASALRQAQADYAGGGPDINAAIAALPAGGGKGVLIERVVNIAADIVINTSATKLEGRGAVWDTHVTYSGAGVRTKQKGSSTSAELDDV